MAVVGVNAYIPSSPGIGTLPLPTAPAGGTSAPAPAAPPQPTTTTGPQPLNTNGPLGTTVNIVT